MTPEERTDQEFQNAHPYWSMIPEKKKAKYMEDVRNSFAYKLTLLQYTTIDAIKGIWNALRNK